MNHLRNKQRGAALVVGLILLVVITLLAVVGMNIANTELAGATSEQLRMRAFNAAETGLETRLQTLALDATTSGTPVKGDPTAVENSPVNPDDEPTDTFQLTTTYWGEGTMLSRFTTGTFAGFHYSIESTGRSVRGAVAVHTAGAFIVNAVGDSNVAEEVDPDEAPVNELPPT
jgi:type IV pilus assembly protein PilX